MNKFLLLFVTRFFNFPDGQIATDTAKIPVSPRNDDSGYVKIPVLLPMTTPGTAKIPVLPAMTEAVVRG